MIKVIPNRTTGLQNKHIDDKAVMASCPECEGRQVIRNTLAASCFKNLKAMSGPIEVETDCVFCEGTGKIHSKVRVIKRNQITAII